MNSTKFILALLVPIVIFLAVFFGTKEETRPMENTTEHTTDFQEVDLNATLPITPPAITANGESVESLAYDWYDPLTKRVSNREPDASSGLDLFTPVQPRNDKLAIAITTAAIPERIYTQQFSSVGQSMDSVNTIVKEFSLNDPPTGVTVTQDKKQFTLLVDENRQYLTVTLQYTNPEFFKQQNDEIPLNISANYLIKLK